MRTPRTLLTAALALAVVGADSLAAKFYQWTDGAGRTHFSDRLPPASARDIQTRDSLRTTPRGTPTAANDQSWELRGEISRVRDGDSLDVSVGGATLQLRLHGIDAPEHKQAYGEASKQALTRLAKGKPVRLHVKDTDRYGRNVARVQVLASGAWLDLNREMVRQGHAWVYRQFADDPQLDLLERQARLARRGLWADLRPMPPWEWRRRNPRR